MFTFAPQPSQTTSTSEHDGPRASVSVASARVSLPAGRDRAQPRTSSYTLGYYTSPQRRIRGRYISRVE